MRGILKKLLKTEYSSFEERFPVYYIDDEHDCMVFKNGRVAIGFEIEFPETESLDREQIVRLELEFVSSIIADLPDLTQIQFFDSYYEIAYQTEKKEAKYLEKKQYAQHIDSPVDYHASYIFLNFPVSSKKTNINPFNSFFARGRGMFENPFDRIEERLAEAVSIGEKCANSMRKNDQISMKKLSGEKIRNILYQYFNLEFDKSKQAFEKAIFNGESEIIVGEVKANVVTMIGQGLEVAETSNGFGVDQPFSYPIHLGLRFPHIVISTIEKRNKEDEIKSLQTDRKVNMNMPYVGKTDAHDQKEKEITAFIAEVGDSNSTIVGLNISIIVYSISDYQRRNRVQEAKDGLRSMRNCEPFVEGIDTTNIFFSLCPGNSDGYRWVPVRLEVAARYLNFTTLYSNFTETGTDSKIKLPNPIPVLDRFGNPRNLNVPSIHNDNYNAIVLGPPGSGKSFLMNFFIVLRWVSKYVQIIIDKGGTYKNIIAALGGKYYEYDPSNPFRFNPFFIKKQKEFYIYSEAKINALIDFLEILWKGSEGEILSTSERAFFLKVVPFYYDHLNENGAKELPMFKGFYSWLQHYVNQELSHDVERDLEFVNVKKFFTDTQVFVDGQYKEILASEEEVDLSESILICFDLNKIHKNKILYPLVSLIITQLVTEQLDKYPDTWKFLYFDEVWSMLSGFMLKFIEESGRTLRKQKAGIYIISQNHNDIKQCASGEAIKATFETRFVLRHKDGAIIDDLCDYFDFTRHLKDKITSIRSAPDWREFFIHSGDTGKVFILKACDEIALLSSSTPDVRNALVRYLKRYKSVDRAVMQYLEDEQLDSIN